MEQSVDITKPLISFIANGDSVHRLSLTTDVSNSAQIAHKAYLNLAHVMPPTRQLGRLST